MDDHFQNYGNAVCKYINHATGREKDSIRAELAAHMEDHAQALMDAGYDEDHARNAALTAMGDPAEVGKALNREYPLRWLILSRLFLTLAVCTGLLLLLAFPGGVYASLVARTAPMQSGYHTVSIPAEELTPMDIKQTFPNGDVLWVYATAITGDDDQGYTAHIYTSSYNKNPLRDPYYGVGALLFTTDASSDVLPRSGGGGGTHGAAYFHRTFDCIPKGASLLGHYDQYGTEFTIEIPLPWEEVATP
ncbi:MAG: permease prefix domain 1-containing protein [Bacillota bacterium]|nr:permease prefix domain 1-containing protein [Bacillota bacterium]